MVMGGSDLPGRVSACLLGNLFGLNLLSSEGRGAGRRYWRWLHYGPHLSEVCKLLCSCSILHIFIAADHLQEKKKHSQIMLLVHIF